jgi:hypothetical protein
LIGSAGVGMIVLKKLMLPQTGEKHKWCGSN